MWKDLFSGSQISWRLGNSIIKLSNRFAALENLSDSEDISRVWENIKENIKHQLKRVYVGTN
jgi:hypothetical protein